MRTQIGTQITVEKKTGNLRAYSKTVSNFLMRFNLLFLQMNPTLQHELPRFIKASESAYREIDPKMI